MPELRWTQSSFIQPQMMVEDRYFYDPVAGKYTVDRYLDDLEKRYGGIDSVLIWPTYSNMGIDNRNQHDMIRAMPGGVAGVRQMVADFHRRGVRVLFPMMMWDQGTRDPGKPWPDAIAELMAEIGADGINGDTQDGVPLAFSLAADKIRSSARLRARRRPRRRSRRLRRDDVGAIRDSELRAARRSLQMARAAPHGQHHRSLESRQNRRSAIRIFQWRRLGELGKRLGHLERHHAARCRSDSPRGDDGTRACAVSRQRAMGAVRADDALWSVRKPLAARRCKRFGRSSIATSTTSMGRRSNYPPPMACVTSICITASSFSPTRNGDKVTLSFAIDDKDYGAILATKSAPDAKIAALMAQMRLLTASPLCDLFARMEIPAAAARRNRRNEAAVNAHRQR